MTKKELYIVLATLEKIKQPNPFADEAIAYIKKDIARRAQQSEAMRKMNRENYEGVW